MDTSYTANAVEVAAGAPSEGAQPPAGASPPLPPITNRGVIVANANGNSINVGLHWLAVTVHTNARALVELVMDVLVGAPLADPDKWLEHFIDTGFSGRRYKGIYSGPFGISLYAYPNLGTHCHLEIKGEAIEAIGQVRVFEFLQALDGLKAPETKEHPEEKPAKWSVRRVDIALDGMPFTPRQCYDAFLRGDVRCSASRKSFKWFSNSEGDTLYIGSRASGRLVRIYNRRGFTRLELESKGQWANLVGSELAAQGCGGFESWAIAYVRQFLDFVDASTGGSVTRADLLPWWQDFVGSVDRASLKRKESGPVGDAVTRARLHLERLSCTLCVIRNGLGISLDDVCNLSEYRLKPKHIQQIEEIRRGLGS